jgi:hypothetical protein
MGPRSKKVLDGEDLSGLFGLEMAGTDAAAEKPKRAKGRAGKKAAAVRAAKG